MILLDKRIGEKYQNDFLKNGFCPQNPTHSTF